MATAEGFDLTHGKQFTLFTHMGPNPWKITFLLHELGLGDQYHGILLEGDEVREPRFTKYNPNGRAPALIDHANNDFAIWESGAIMEYIVQKYDTEHKFSFESFEERMEALQYLMLQMSGKLAPPEIVSVELVHIGLAKDFAILQDKDLFGDNLAGS